MGEAPGRLSMEGPGMSLALGPRVPGSALCRLGGARQIVGGETQVPKLLGPVRTPSSRVHSRPGKDPSWSAQTSNTRGQVSSGERR